MSKQTNRQRQTDEQFPFVGIEVVDFDLYPDETFQKRWLRIYLEERARLTGLTSDS